MEAQLANLAHWVQSAVVQSGGSTGAPSSVKSTSSASVTSDSTSPLIDSASSSKCMATSFCFLCSLSLCMMGKNFSR